MAENREAIDRLIEQADQLADAFERIAQSGELHTTLQTESQP